MTVVDGDTRFAEVLDDCCQRVRRGEALERCLAEYPAAYREELARLVPLTGQVSRLGGDPSTAFQAQLEQRLLAATHDARWTQRSPLWQRVGRFFASTPVARVAALAATIALLLIGSGMGAVQAAESSLPDDPLYNVKVAREWVELALARGGENQVNAYTRHIVQRGRELEAAVRTGKPPRVVDALSARVALAVDRMVSKAEELRSQGKPRPALQVSVALRMMQRRLDRLAEEALPNVRPSLRRLDVFLEQQEQRLRAGSTNPPRRDRRDREETSR